MLKCSPAGYLWQAHPSRNLQCGDYCKGFEVTAESREQELRHSHLPVADVLLGDTADESGGMLDWLRRKPCRCNQTHCNQG